MTQSAKPATVVVVTLDDLIARATKPATTLVIESDILAEAAEAVAADKHKQAVNACKGLIETFTNTLGCYVRNLRAVRQNEKQQTELVQKADRATKYFAKTGNPLPMYGVMGRKNDASYWCQNIGIPYPADNDPAWNVPDDFKTDPVETDAAN